MGNHICRTLVIACMDFRFHSWLRNLLVDCGLKNNYDMFVAAGSQKNFLDPETRDFALRQVDLSVNLHLIKEVFIFAHLDCGAYGGSGSFASQEQEIEQYETDLAKVRKMLKERHPHLVIRTKVICP